MRIKGCLIAVVALAIFSANVLKPDFRSTYNDLEYSFSGVFKPESFFGKNTNWFNNDNDFDKSYVSKHVLDLALNAWYGAKTYGEIILEFMFQVRNKGIW